MWSWGGSAADQVCQETASLSEADGDEPVSGGVPPPFFCRGGDGEVDVGEHSECYRAVPGVVTADLVFIQPDLAFRGLKTILDCPPVTATLPTRMSSSSSVAA